MSIKYLYQGLKKMGQSTEVVQILRVTSMTMQQSCKNENKIGNKKKIAVIILKFEQCLLGGF